MNSRFYYRMTYKGDGTSTPVTIDAPFVTNLSAKVRQVATLVVLANDEGRSPQGLYQWANDRWRLALPQVDISLGVVVGYDIDVYYNLQIPVVITEEGARIFRNGAPFNDTTLTADGNFVWAVMTPANGTGIGNVRAVNGVSPDSTGNVEIDIGNIPGLEEALAEAGKVKTVNAVEPDTGGNVQISIADIPNLQTLLDAKVTSVNGVLPINGELTLVAIDVGALATDLLGQSNGVASLDVNGKIPTSQLPASVLGALKYQGGYNANTNVPPLPVPGPDNVGFYWVTTDAGTQQGKDLQVGDWIVSNGTAYDEVDNQNMVSSVNGKLGVVVIGISDISGLQATLDSKVGPLTSAGGVTLLSDGTNGVLKGLAQGAGITLTPSGSQVTISADIGVESINGQAGAINVQGDGSTIQVDTTADTLTLSYIGTPGGVSSVNTLTGALNVIGDGTAIQVTTNGQNIVVTYTGGGSGGNAVTSLNGLINTLNLVNGSSLISIVPDEASGSITIDTSALGSVRDTTVSDPGAVALVADQGTSGVALIKQLVGGANIVLTPAADSITLDVLSGGGTVKSVNGIEPTDPATGNVPLGASDVGAVSRTGDTMEGLLNMNSNAIKNLPDATDDTDPITISFLNSGNIVIDAGTF